MLVQRKDDMGEVDVIAILFTESSKVLSYRRNFRSAPLDLPNPREEDVRTIHVTFQRRVSNDVLESSRSSAVRVFFCLFEQYGSALQFALLSVRLF